MAITWVTRRPSASCAGRAFSNDAVSWTFGNLSIAADATGYTVFILWLCRDRRLLEIDRFMRQPRTDRRRNEANQAIEHELQRAAVGSPVAVEKFRSEERDRADDQHPAPRHDALEGGQGTGARP